MDCDLLVKNGRVVSAEGIDAADVAVKDGRLIVNTALGTSFGLRIFLYLCRLRLRRR